MAIKRGSKVDMGGSSASQTDLIFLLLLFLMISTTLINPTPLKLLLTKSSTTNKGKPYTTVSITADVPSLVDTDTVPLAEPAARTEANTEGVEHHHVRVDSARSVSWDERGTG